MNPESILIRLPNWVGDVLMATPTLRALRSSFPQARITALGKPWARDLLSDHPSIDEVLTFPFQASNKNGASTRELLKTLSERNAQWGLLFPNSVASALLFFLARIPNRVGYTMRGRGILLTNGVPPPSHKTHEIDSFLGLLKGFSITGEFDRTLYFPVNQEKENLAAEFWKSCGIKDSDVIVGFNPGAAWGPSKRWLPKHFAEAGDLFQREMGAKIVIFGGPEDVNIAQEIATAMSLPPLIAAGRDNLRVLPALLKRCNLFITNDTGPMHIAASQNVPQLTLFGPTDPGKTSYSNDITKVVRKDLECAPCFKRECPLGHHQCMVGISANEIFLAGADLLRSRA